MTPTLFAVHRLHQDAFLPERGTSGSIGYDLRAYLPHRPDFCLQAGQRALFKLGFAATVPFGTYGRIAPRSGLALKFGIDVMAGVIDRDYTGEWGVILLNTSEAPFSVRHGDKIAQVILELCIVAPIVDVPALVQTDRGDGGYGSTGV